MTWKVEIQDEARKELRKLDKGVQSRILRFLRGRVATEEDPRRLGKPLKGGLKAFWRYRVGDFRIVCRIRDEVVTVLVVRVRHRRDVYR